MKRNAVSKAAVEKQNNEPPEVLLIMQEEVKPAQAEAYQGLQRKYADLLSQSKFSYPRLGLTPITGKANEALLIIGLDSIDSVEGALEEMSKLRTGRTQQKVRALDKQAEQLLTGKRTSISLLRPDMSLRADVAASALPDSSHFQITTVRLRPGGEQEWARAVADCVNVLGRSNVQDQYLVYQSVSGEADGTFMILRPRNSIAELGKMRDRNQAAMSALGAEKVRSLSKVMRETFLNQEDALYAVSFSSGY